MHMKLHTRVEINAGVNDGKEPPTWCVGRHFLYCSRGSMCGIFVTSAQTSHAISEWYSQNRARQVFNKRMSQDTMYSHTLTRQPS